MLREIIDEIKQSDYSAYFMNNFSDDNESLTDSICQFDLVHCLFTDIHRNESSSFEAWPYFVIYYLDKIDPLLVNLIDDNYFRNEILGSHLNDRKLALFILGYLHKAQFNLERNNNIMRGFWKFSAPPLVVEFMNANLTQSEIKGLRQYWWEE